MSKLKASKNRCFQSVHFLVYPPISTDLFIFNGNLDFANNIITIDHIDLILSGINAHLFSKFGNNIQRNKATVLILVKETKTWKNQIDVINGYDFIRKIEGSVIHEHAKFVTKIWGQEVNLNTWQFR